MGVNLPMLMRQIPQNCTKECTMSIIHSSILPMIAAQNFAGKQSNEKVSQKIAAVEKPVEFKVVGFVKLPSTREQLAKAKVRPLHIWDKPAMKLTSGRSPLGNKTEGHKDLREARRRERQLARAKAAMVTTPRMGKTGPNYKRAR